MPKCPFKAGEYVIYQPSERGYNLIDGVRPVIGKKYLIIKIEMDNYVAIEGFDDPACGGGIYWTEFKKAD